MTGVLRARQTRWRLPQLVLVHASSGIPLVTGAGVVAVSLLTALLLDGSSLTGGAADALNVALVGVLYLAPLAAGAAATAGGALWRSGILRLACTAPRGRSRALLLTWASVASWQLVGFAGLTGLLLARVGTSGMSPAMLLLPALAVALLLAVTAGGIMLGSLYPGRVTGPMAALVLFAVLFALSFAQGRLAAFSVIFPSTFYQPWFEPNAALLAWQILLATSLLLGAVAGMVMGRGGAVLASFAAVLTILAVSSLLRTDPNPVQLRSSSADASCASRGGVTLCVWPQAQSALAPGVQSLSQFVNAAKPFLDVPRSYRQPGLKRPRQAATVLLPGDARTVDDAAFYTSLAVMSHYQCDNGRRGEAAAAALFTWLVARVSPESADVTSEGFRAATAPPASQQAWVNTQVSRLRGCSR